MNKPEKEITYYEDGGVEREIWHLNGKYHREDGPAYIHYREDGSVEKEIWRLDGEAHRKDGTAITYYRQDGSVKREIWYLNGECHREDGPAWVSYYKDGSVAEESWHFEDKQLLKKDFKSLEQIKEMKAFRLFTPVDVAKMRCETINE